MKNFMSTVKPVLTPHLWYKAMLKVWTKLWEPFRIYQLTSTANPAQFIQLQPDWLCQLAGTDISQFTLLMLGHIIKRKQKPHKWRLLSSTKGEENKITNPVYLIKNCGNWKRGNQGMPVVPKGSNDFFILSAWPDVKNGFSMPSNFSYLFLTV